MRRKKESRRVKHTGHPDVDVKLKLPANVLLALEAAAGRSKMDTSTWLRKYLEREFRLGIYGETG